MKQVIIMILILLILTGCSRIPETYQFTAPIDSIKSIELIQNNNPNGEGTNEEFFVILKSLDKTDSEDFMHAVYEIPTKRVGTPPPWGYGPYFARVTYSNGDIDILGVWNLEFIESGTSPSGVGDYKFADDKFEQLFFEYAELCEMQ